MKTEVIKIDKNKPEQDKLRRAAAVLERGGVIIFPTDTVYGFAANAFIAEARQKIYALKGRAYNKPLIVMPPDISSLNCLVEITPRVSKLMETFWPGPLTLVLPVTDIGRMVMGGRADMGVRIPENRAALELLKLCAFPLATTSANPSSKPGAKSAREAGAYFMDKVDMIIDSGTAEIGHASTVVDMTHFHGVVVREGCLPSKKLLPYL